MKLLVSLFLTQLMLFSCEVSQVQSTEALIDSPVISKPLVPTFIGKDIDGEIRECEETTDLVCAEVFTEEDQFGLDCLRDGDLAIQCGCHDWICIIQEEIPDEKERNGFDLNGDPKSCVPVTEGSKDESLVCTMVFTAEDQFAYDCEEAGHEAVKCGCHDWLCIESIEAFQN